MSEDQLLQFFLESTGVSTDTRTIKPGVIFFALKGEHFDGNQFIQEALNKGARWVVCEAADYSSREDCILVKDAIVALQNLARSYRQTFDIPVIALTGSNGKTTTKELLVAVLSERYKVHATRGNYNNHIGVPLTLLEMKRDSEVAVIEMGANHQKEIKVLADIALPTFGLITNIGLAHLEGFGSREGIAYGKFELFDHLISRNLPILYYKDAYLLEQLAGSYPYQLTIQSTTLEVHGVTYNFSANSYEPSIQLVVSFPEGEVTINSALFGKHNALNIIMAFAVGRYFDISPMEISFAVGNYIADNNRSQKTKWNGADLILDAYNANPTSMHAALESFMRMNTHKKHIVVLGEMNELGDYTTQAHLEIIEVLKKFNPEIAVLVGKSWEIKGVQFPPHYHLLNDVTELEHILMNSSLEDRIILVKGSRSNRLEAAFKSC